MSMAGILAFLELSNTTFQFIVRYIIFYCTFIKLWSLLCNVTMTSAAVEKHRLENNICYELV
jgi:hypothetical protein